MVLDFLVGFRAQVNVYCIAHVVIDSLNPEESRFRDQPCSCLNTNQLALQEHDEPY